MNTYQRLSVIRVETTLLNHDHYAETHDNPQASLRDVLTDLGHFADHYGLNFNEILRNACQVYLEEKAAA